MRAIQRQRSARRTQAATRLQHCHAVSLTEQVAGCSEARNAAANNYDIKIL
jgi:hypothetical protein